jgi:hypothetical protein
VAQTEKQSILMLSAFPRCLGKSYELDAEGMVAVYLKMLLAVEGVRNRFANSA